MERYEYSRASNNVVRLLGPTDTADGTAMEGLTPTVIIVDERADTTIAVDAGFAATVLAVEDASEYAAGDLILIRHDDGAYTNDVVDSAIVREPPTPDTIIIVNGLVAGATGAKAGNTIERPLTATMTLVEYVDSGATKEPFKQDGSWGYRFTPSRVADGDLSVGQLIGLNYYVDDGFGARLFFRLAGIVVS